jgi:hypothetical protein
MPRTFLPWEFLWVEVQDQLFAALVGESEGTAAGAEEA